jgi:hypothetical protein
MSNRTNDVTLFSNGIGHFRRTYKVTGNKEHKFSIPFKRDHIGDVAASLSIFGKVRLTTPPSFTPSNANATSLDIDSNDALKSLLRSLSGSAVRVRYNNGTEKSYTLLGLDTDRMVENGTEMDKDYIALMSGGGVKRKLLSEIEDVYFEDEGVRTEIDKALKNNFQKIKPDSTLLDFSLSPLGDGETEAVVQYTIPVAAWKMRYAIRQDGDAFTLEGAAIIDNNTDEDWDNFRVSVVTGNPISFKTDIATVVMPNRKTVQLVDTSVLGNVGVQDGYVEESYGQLESAGSYGPALAACGPAGGAGRARGLSKRSVSNYAQFGMSQADSAPAYMDAAESAGVESKEVGDFSVFTAKEAITILARKSAVVPMFTVPLTKAGVVLLYKQGNHATRPYRTVKFKNEAEFSLGKGKTVIYNSGIFSGECVLETAKPGENRMLPHCLENGVNVVREQKPMETRRQSLKLAEGVGVTEDVYTVVTKYTLTNKKDEKFKISLEHENALNGQANLNVDFDGLEVKEKEKLSDGSGYRAYFELAPKQSVTLTVTETSLTSTSVTIGGHYNWVKMNIIDTKNPLSKDKQINAVVKVQTEIDETNAELAETRVRASDLEKQVTRVRENLAAAKDVGNSSTVAEWVSDLDKTEKEIRKINKTEIPALTAKVRELQAKLADEIRKVTVVWKG